jgi:membrane fusion protein (multidrug efflux system)
MRKTMFLLMAALLSLSATSCGRRGAAKPAPPKVEVLTVTPREVPIYQQWIGTLDGYPNAQIRAQVSGYLMKQDYVEGGRVKQGDLLFEIDPRPFQAVLDQASARLEQDQALLGKTELDVARATPLAKEQAVSQQELDDATQSNLMAKAAVAADKATLESARLNLDFTRITSPVDGIAGIAQAQIGDLVGPGTAVLTTVSTVDPIRAYFNISEQFYLTYSRQHPMPAAKDAPEDDIPLELILSDGTVYPKGGKWLFTGRQVDINTGTMQVAASFENPDCLLRPGQYALVRARTETREGALLVPQRAVAELQGSYQIATVDQDNKVHIKTVQVGEQIGTNWLIETGITANDRVVAEGVQKIKEGAVVDPQPFAASQADPPPAAAPSGVRQ